MPTTRSSKRQASPTRDDQPSDRPPKRRKGSALTRTTTSDVQETDKANSKTEKRRRTKGKLSLIMTIPIDVFCEIARHLSPKDLLAMARASKTLRNLLMSKSSSTIWTTAIRAVELPACPPDLNCPQYASLVYDNFCMSCLAPHVSQLDIRMRYRLCRKCFKSELIFGEDKLDRRAKDLAMVIPYSSTIYKDDKRKHYKPVFETAKQQFLSLADKETKAVFLENKRQELEVIFNHAEEVRSWLYAREKLKEEAIRDVVNRRIDSIHRRLRELGYTQNDFPTREDGTYELWHSIRAEPRELTDRIWNNIRSKMEDIIGRTKESRRQACRKEREYRLRSVGYEILSSPDGRHCFYSFGELLLLPAAVAYLRANGLDCTLSEADRQVITEKILELGALRKQEIMEKCDLRMMEALAGHDLLQPDFKLLENHKSMLEYKCAFFGIKQRPDLSIRTFENVLEQYKERTLSSYRSDDRRLGIYEGLMEEYVPNIEACTIADKLAKALGVGDQTMRELDALSDVFVCKLCKIQYQQYRWSMLVGHFYRERKPPSSSYYARSYSDHSLDGKEPSEYVECSPETKALLRS